MLDANNRRGVFDNLGDTQEGLREILGASFERVEIETVGSIRDLRGHESAHELVDRHDTITTPDSLAPPRSRYNAHEVRTSQAECRGFESRLPLHFLFRAQRDTLLALDISVVVQDPLRVRATTLRVTGDRARREVAADSPTARQPSSSSGRSQRRHAARPMLSSAISRETWGLTTLRCRDNVYAVEVYDVEMNKEPTMLEIRDLEKSYGETAVLDGVDLNVASGEIVGLLGPNGAGKTTLVSIVAGLRAADRGAVTVDGQDALVHPARIRPLLGLAPQDLGIYPLLTVRQNLRLFGELAGLSGLALDFRVGEVAEALDLTELLPKKAGTLSGGQKRRLHTAMALVHRPRLLFLDEPTVGADVQSRGRILDVVRDLADGGCAVVYTSHYLPEIEELAATVAILERGRIVAHGPLDEIVRMHGSPALRLTFDGPAPDLDGFEVHGGEALLRTPEPAQAAATVLDRLNGAGGRLRSVDIVRPSLEAAYLALTGRRSNDEAERPTEIREEVSHELVA